MSDRRPGQILATTSVDTAAAVSAIPLAQEYSFDSIRNFASYQKYSIMVTIAAMRATKGTGIALDQAYRHWHKKNTDFFYKVSNKIHYALRESR